MPLGRRRAFGLHAVPRRAGLAAMARDQYPEDREARRGCRSRTKPARKRPQPPQLPQVLTVVTQLPKVTGSLMRPRRVPARRTPMDDYIRPLIRLLPRVTSALSAAPDLANVNLKCTERTRCDFLRRSCDGHPPVRLAFHAVSPLLSASWAVSANPPSP